MSTPDQARQALADELAATLRDMAQNMSAYSLRTKRGLILRAVTFIDEVESRAEKGAAPHELDDMPPKVLRELSAKEFGAYITHLRNQTRELARARRERDDARAGCKGLSERLAAFAESTEELIACHDEPSCPAVSVARSLLADHAALKEGER